MAPPKQFKEQFGPKRVDEAALRSFESFAVEGDDVRDVSDGVIRSRRSVMQKWNKFWNEEYKTKDRKRVDPDDIWLRLCDGDEDAKEKCKIFLQAYVTTQGKWEVSLGPEEYQWKRTITSAISLTDVWKDLVVQAHNTVLLRQRKADREHRLKWNLSFAIKKGRGPVADISQWIANEMALKFNLSTRPLRPKRDATPEDITLFLETLWTRSADIPMPPLTRIAMHTFLLIASIAGSRPGSILNIPYSRVQVGLLRDPVDPDRVELVASILVIHNKRMKGVLQRTQDDEIEFTITLVPCHKYCLLSLILARAFAEDAFQAGYRSFDDLYERPCLDPGIDYVPLPWKQSMMENILIPMSHNTMSEYWNRIVLVSGVREHETSYILRRGAAGRLNGVLIAALACFIVSQSQKIFQTAYQGRRIKEDLPSIHFGRFGGGGGANREKVYRQLSRATLNRDERAPIDPTDEDLKKFGERNDIRHLRKQLGSPLTKAERNSVSGQIRSIIQSLSLQRVRQLRKEYFDEADKRQGNGLPACDPKPSAKQTPTPSERIGQFLLGEECSEDGTIDRTREYVGMLVDYALGRAPSPCCKDVIVVMTKRDPDEELPSKTSQFTCLLCEPYESFTKRSSLSRHFERTHLEEFRAPFACPACPPSTSSELLIKTPQGWSNHAETYHGIESAPVPPALAKATTVRCLVCSGAFSAGQGFTRHIRKHFNDGKFDQPFQCAECPAWIHEFDKWKDHVALVHGGSRGSGAVPAPDCPPQRQRTLTRSCREGLTPVGG